jgi:hypothetical protein
MLGNSLSKKCNVRSETVVKHGLRRTAVLFIVVIVLQSLIGCVPKTSLVRSDLVYFRKGLTPSEVAAIATTAPKCVVEVDRDNSAIVEVFPMSSSSYYGDYYVLYVDGKLDYWGYPHEFLRSEDSRLNKAGKLLGQLPPCTVTR